MFTPAIRATRSALPLLVARIRADDQHDAAPPDHPATLTHRLYGRSYLHPLLAGRIQSVTEKACGPHESDPRAQRRPYGRRRMVAGQARQPRLLRRAERPAGPPSVGRAWSEADSDAS